MLIWLILGGVIVFGIVVAIVIVVEANGGLDQGGAVIPINPVDKNNNIFEQSKHELLHKTLISKNDSAKSNINKVKIIFDNNMYRVLLRINGRIIYSKVIGVCRNFDIDLYGINNQLDIEDPQGYLKPCSIIIPADTKEIHLGGYSLFCNDAHIKIICTETPIETEPISNEI